MQVVPFKAANHNITTSLERYACELLAYGFTNKEVADLTGLGKNTVKAIDLKRLKDKYTVDGKTLIKPERTAKYLGIDEFNEYFFLKLFDISRNPYVRNSKSHKICD